MSDKDIRTCKNCGKKYMIEIFGDCYEGGREQEEVVCPWCNNKDGVVSTSGLVRVEKVDEIRED